MVSKRDSSGGGGNALGLWDGNLIKLDCDDHCTTLNVINSLSNFKKVKNKQTNCSLNLIPGSETPHASGQPKKGKTKTGDL